MTVRAELQRRLAQEFERRGWEYNLSVGPTLVDQILQGETDPVALARTVSADFRRREGIDVAGLVDAIADALRGTDLSPRPSPRAMRLLMVAASPENEIRLRLDAEHREVRSHIRASTDRQQVTLELASAARPTDLLDELNRTRPTILHLAGHGGATGIALENARGMAVDVSTDQLLRLISIADTSLRLVVLNTCDSAHQAQPISEIVDAAIGMTKSIGDEAACVFSAQLYSSLAERVSLDRAFEQARLQIALAGSSEDTTPALYLKAGVEAREMIFTN